MGRRADVLDAESSAQLSRFQCEVLSWSFYDLGGAADAARQAQLRHVPASFASFQARGVAAKTQQATSRPPLQPRRV